MTDSTKGATDVHLTENTVGWISERKVTIFNVWEREYERADGTKVEGTAGTLGVTEPDGLVQRVVGLGSRVKIGADVYDVVAIDGGEGRDDEMGFIVLRRVQAAGGE